MVDRDAAAPERNEVGHPISVEVLGEDAVLGLAGEPELLEVHTSALGRGASE
jgi:hypothetical protein